jgi:hypothetical protein
MLRLIARIVRLFRAPPVVLPPPDRSTVREGTRIATQQLYIRKLERQQ